MSLSIGDMSHIATLTDRRHPQLKFYVYGVQAASEQAREEPAAEAAEAEAPTASSQVQQAAAARAGMITGLNSYRSIDADHRTSAREGPTD
jgi:hypothetical protein